MSPVYMRHETVNSDLHSNIHYISSYIPKIIFDNTSENVSKVAGNTILQPHRTQISENVISENKFKKNDLKTTKNENTRGRARNWVFTDFTLNQDNWVDNPIINYIYYGVETCPTTGKQHHQGFMQLQEKKEMSYIKKHIHKNIHLEVMHGSRDENVLYCSKKGLNETIYERGTFECKGQRNDINQVVNDIKSGSFDVFNPMYLKYHNAIDKLITIHKSDEQGEAAKQDFNDNIKDLTLDQKIWLHLLENQNKRQILWIYDTKGGHGKSIFAKWLHFNREACILDNAGSGDLAYAYNYEKIVCFDYARDIEERLNYSIIEKLKDGVIFSKKFQSKTKYFVPPSIICFSNFKPNVSKMSADRWNVLEFNNETNRFETMNMDEAVHNAHFRAMTRL